MFHPSSLCTVLIIVYSTLNMLDNVYTDAGRAPTFFTKYQTLGIKVMVKVNEIFVSRGNESNSSVAN